MAHIVYGIAEIAQAIGARRETVAQWHRRGKLPLPDEELAMGPVWQARTIEPWINRYREGGGDPMGIIDREWVTEDGYRVVVTKFRNQTVRYYHGAEVLDPCVKTRVYAPTVQEPRTYGDYMLVGEHILYGPETYDRHARNRIGDMGAVRSHPPDPAEVDRAVEELLARAREKYPNVPARFAAHRARGLLGEAATLLPHGTVVWRDGRFIVDGDKAGPEVKRLLEQATFIVRSAGDGVFEWLPQRMHA